MLESLKSEVCQANLSLVYHGLVLFTWGNVSAIDRQAGLLVIKPSGVSYDRMTADDMVVVDLEGKVIEGGWRPSSDTATHIALYQGFEEITAVVHTHSKWATIWAQAARAIPALGTTHADHFLGDIPVTRSLVKAEIEQAYELETGKVILETFQKQNLSPLEIPAVLVANHGPFAWGTSLHNAVENAAVLEYVAEMAFHALVINPHAQIDKALLDRHFFRKHGKNATYGQKPG